MKKIISVISLIALVSFIAGCNTVAGIGQDVERGGQKVENGARNVQNRTY